MPDEQDDDDGDDDDGHGDHGNLVITVVKISAMQRIKKTFSS